MGAYYRTMTKQQQYNDMWAKHLAGEISDEAWFEFLDEVFDEVLADPGVQAALAQLQA